jgi:putative ABC transport system permease protein
MKHWVPILYWLAHPTRAIVSLLGVAFALLLVFVQLGFRGAVERTASIVYGRLDCDLVIQAREYLHLYEPRSFPRSVLDLSAACEAVERVEPFWIMLQRWQSPSDGRYRAIGAMAMPPGRNLFDEPDLDRLLPALSTPHRILIDRATRADYGPRNGKRFGDDDLELTAELNGREVQIVGHFLIGTGLATNGAVLINEVGFGMRAPYDTRQRCSLGLVRLKPGSNRDQAARSLTQLLEQRAPDLAESVVVRTLPEAIRLEHRHWLTGTPIGSIFQMGVALAFCVGAALVYLVLAQDVANRIKEFATMKAMGYRQRDVAWMVMQQAWYLALLGFVPAALLAELLYRLTVALTGIPIEMNGWRLAGVLLLSVAMCTLSGLGAIRKLAKAEPAELF